ncbi:MAG: hypothetical protein AABY40_02360 [Nanoarchaeota archaeon]|mgnify:CR=1 FL=1
MQTLNLYLPTEIETARLRKDLEEIIANYCGKEKTYFAFPLPYAVGLAQVYEFPSKGIVITVTNDTGIFCEENLPVPGGKLWYNAKIYFLGFDEEALEFQGLRQNFEYLNSKY